MKSSNPNVIVNEAGEEREMSLSDYQEEYGHLNEHDYTLLIDGHELIRGPTPSNAPRFTR